jgi:hypothetical protein
MLRMAIVKGITWKLEVGIKPDNSRFTGYEETETFRLFANTHDKAVEILKRFRKDLNVDHILKSEREGLTVIVDFPEKGEN